jgi:hypothetical protein
MGFALTLLVLSLEVPEDFESLVNTLKGLPAFAACFALLVWVWYMHYKFFRRYGLQDRTTIFLNSVLLFVVLVYVYPLKFLFVGFMEMMTGLAPHGTSGRGQPRIAFEQVDDLFVIYGVGFVALFLMFALLHMHAYRRRGELGLNAIEVMETRLEIARAAALACVGLCSMGIALFAPSRYVALAGWCYGLISVVEFFAGLSRGRAREQLAARAH